MGKKEINNPLLRLQSNLNSKTASSTKDENTTKVTLEEVETNSGENKEISIPPQNAVNKEADKNKELILNFVDFFNKDYSTNECEQIFINKDLKRIIEKISGNRSGTTQASLVSNIIKSWINTNRKDIEKILKDQAKVEF